MFAIRPTLLIRGATMAFFNRTDELNFLCAQARDDRAALVVLYGRRRTGKTAS